MDHYNQEEKTKSRLGILALVLGIIGLVTSCIVIGIIPSIAALIISIVALRRGVKKAMPVAALLCSLGGIVICVSFLVAIGIDTEKQVANIPDGTEEAANISDGIEEAENISDMTEEVEDIPDGTEEASAYAKKIDETETVVTQNSENDGKEEKDSSVQENPADEDLPKESDNFKTQDKSPKVELVYSVGAIEDSLKDYSYQDNPYYLEGIDKFTNGLNEFYAEIQSGQKIEIRSLNDVLKEAGVSRSLQKQILSAEGKNVLTDADFFRIEEKKDKKIFFSKGNYYEVSSKAKDDMDELDILNVLYYLGKLKDNKPDGEGALFSIWESGIRLLYAGSFKEGRINKNGVLFCTDSLGSVILGLGKFEDGAKNGHFIDYNASDIQSIYELYRNNWNEYKEEYYNFYSANEKNRVLENLFEKDKVAELMYITECYEASKTEEFNIFDIRINYPVIQPIISYEGDYKSDKYSGTGTLYGGCGTLWYQGEFKNGKYHGEGTLYYPFIEVVKYEGKFSRGKADGKGVIYNEDGTVIKKGKFDEEEIDSEDEMMELTGIYEGIYEKYEEAGLQKFFEKDQLIYNEDADYDYIFGYPEDGDDYGEEYDYYEDSDMEE